MKSEAPRHGQVSIEVNGKTVTAEVEPRLTLLDFIRMLLALKAPTLDVSMVFAVHAVLVEQCDSIMPCTCSAGR